MPPEYFIGLVFDDQLTADDIVSRRPAILPQVQRIRCEESIPRRRCTPAFSREKIIEKTGRSPSRRWSFADETPAPPAPAVKQAELDSRIDTRPTRVACIPTLIQIKHDRKADKSIRIPRKQLGVAVARQSAPLSRCARLSDAPTR